MRGANSHAHSLPTCATALLPSGPVMRHWYLLMPSPAAPDDLLPSSSTTAPSGAVEGNTEPASGEDMMAVGPVQNRIRYRGRCQPQQGCE